MLLGVWLVGWLAFGTWMPQRTAAMGHAVPAAPRVAAQGLVAHGQLRVVHAWPGVPFVDVLVDGEPVRGALAYGADGGYEPVAEGPHTVALVASGQASAAPLLSVPVEITAGSARTLVAHGGPGQALVLDDLALAPVDGPALVRFVHAAPGLAALELAVVAGPRLAGPVEFGAATDYADVLPSTPSLSAVLAADHTTVATLPGAVFVADKSYTIVTIAAAGPAPAALLGLVDD